MADHKITGQGMILPNQGSPPLAPSSGEVRLYALNNTLYRQNSSGNISQLITTRDTGLEFLSKGDVSVAVTQIDIPIHYPDYDMLQLHVFLRPIDSSTRNIRATIDGDTGTVYTENRVSYATNTQVNGGTYINLTLQTPEDDLNYESNTHSFSIINLWNVSDATKTTSLSWYYQDYNTLINGWANYNWISQAQFLNLFESVFRNFGIGSRWVLYGWRRS